MKKSEIPVIDLHNDLLSYLSDKPGRTPNDPLSRSSYADFFQGGVKLQTLAIYTTTGLQSVEKGKSQVNHFLKLLSDYPTLFSKFSPNLNASSPEVQILPAIENASSFALESEPLSDSLKRVEEYIQAIGPIVYIGMTWNDENRFGGGNLTSVGLKEDGKRLLEWMNGKKIAVDFSHTSDRLAYDILDFIENHGLNLPVLASHSNFRAISDYPRNLPNDLAKEIIKRKGLIGLNFFAPFIHNTDPSAILRHVEYGLHLGGENALSFGADLFYEEDFSYILQKYNRKDAFYPGLDNSSVYPSVLELFSQKLKLKEEQLLKIASQNAYRFLKKMQ